MIKLLIVDDEEEIRLGIRDMIDWEANGIKVCGDASNGLEALKAIDELSPDILLIDIRMPLKSGLEVIEAVSMRNLPIKSIVLSGYDDFSYAQKSVKYGASDYLLKPCRPHEILASVLKAKNSIETEKSSKEIYEKLIKMNPLLNTSENISYKKAGNKIISLAEKYINENYYMDLNLETVAGKVYISPGYLSMLFKQTAGINFVDYLHKVRIEKACEMLKDISLKTYEVAFKVGYSDEKYFAQVFKKYTGLTPTQYREKSDI